MKKGLLIDDDKNAAVYATYLTENSDKKLEMVFTHPDASIADLAARAIDGGYDVVCLDYRLDENQAAFDGVNRFKAGPIAQQLRDIAIENPAIDLPIVLVSVEENIRKLFRPDKTAQDLFDESYVKSDIQKRAGEIDTELLALISAYSAAKDGILNRANAASLEILGDLLGLKSEEREIVDHTALTRSVELAAPHLIVGALRRHLLDRNGLLVNEAGLLARLGVKRETSDLPKLRQVLKERGMQYEGVLGEAWPRWWTHRLLQLRNDLETQNLFGLGAAARVEKIGASLGVKLEPALSRWTGKADALLTFACASCMQPTEIAVSVAAYDSYSEPFNEKKRICFTCVATGEFETNHLTIDKRDEFTSDQLMSGKLKSPT